MLFLQSAAWLGGIYLPMVGLHVGEVGWRDGFEEGALMGAAVAMTKSVSSTLRMASFDVSAI